MAGIGLIALLLLVKVVTKFAGVWPSTRLFKFLPREAMYTTLLMSTGLTFGSISALFGLNHQIITQYTILVTVVILSAVVPTVIAQAFFRPGGIKEDIQHSEEVEIPVTALAYSRPESSKKANEMILEVNKQNISVNV